MFRYNSAIFVWVFAPVAAVSLQVQGNKRAPMACKARYITLLQALAGVQSGNRGAASVSSGAGAAASQRSAPLSPAMQGNPHAPAKAADASQSAQQHAQDDPARDDVLPQATSGLQQAPVGVRPLWETVGVLCKAPIEQQLASNIQIFGATTLAGAVEAAAAAQPEAERASPILPYPSAAAVAMGIRVSIPPFS